jgi:hypothetical protein
MLVVGVACFVSSSLAKAYGLAARFGVDLTNSV